MSELEVDEGDDFFRHEFDYKLDYHKENQDFYYPRRAHKQCGTFLAYAVWYEMEDYEREHHEAPDHACFKKLRELRYVEVYKYVTDYQY